MQRSSALALMGLAMVAGAGQAFGQTMNVPDAYAWSSMMPTGYTYAASPTLLPMVHVWVHQQLTDSNGNFDPNTITPVSPYESGARRTGRLAAKRAKTLMTTHGVPSGKICVLIQNFGRDTADCDSGYLAAEPDQSTNFFRSDDRIASMDDEWVDAGAPDHFATRRSVASPNADGRLGRYYRHPFLINANGNPNFAGTPPLREWMREFLLGYKAEQAADGTIPRPDRFYFDAEPLIDPNANANWLHVLKKIAEDETIWKTWLVPGFGRTLQAMYNDHVGAPGPLNPEGLNWPAEANSPSYRAGVLDPSLGLDDTQAGGYYRNVPFLVWWTEICFRVQNEVMKFSAYDVIHDPSYGWDTQVGGEYVVKCGNYNDFNADGGTQTPSGVAERTGWFQDRPAHVNYPWYPRNFDLTPGGSDSSVPNEQIARIAMHRTDAGYQLWAAQINPSTGVATTLEDPIRRFLGVKQWASGDTESPVLYPNKSTYHNYHQRRNYYLPGHPYSTNSYESSRPIMRHTIETAINSLGGNRQDRISPWIMMADGYQGFSGDSADYASEEMMRETQMMLRAKNVKETLFFNAPYSQAVVDDAWDATARVLKDVYSHRVHTYSKSTGPLVFPVPPVETARLEFTLADPSNVNVREYQVDVSPSTTVPNGEGQVTRTTGLVVDFKEQGGTDYDNYNFYDVAVESSVNAAAISGEIYNWDGSAWNLIDTYTFNAPQSADGKYRSRLMLSSTILTKFTSGGSKLIRLKLVHTSGLVSSSTPSFSSSYDLVQVVPVGIGEYRQGGGAGGAGGGGGRIGPENAPFSPADINGDGFVDAADYEQFTGDWLNGEATADLNLDGELDQNDLESFIRTYVNGG